MEQIVNNYCRFCAETKSPEKLLNIDNDESKCNDILLKLSFLNAVYVNISAQDKLPRTVCFICYDSLNKAYSFLDKVKRAQDILTTLLTHNDTRHLAEGDEAFDDFFNDAGDITPVKREDTPDLGASVKIEPKEEIADHHNSSQIEIEALENPANNFDQTLNVQEILDAALKPYSSDLQIYANEVNYSSKKVKSWKEYPWMCAFCNIEFLDIDVLRSHAKVAHGKCAAFSCVDCKGAVGKKGDFEEFVKHVRRHRKCLRNRCHYCDYELNDGETLSAHTKQHFSDSQIHCPHCGDILTDDQSLQQHLLDYITVKPKRKPRRKAGTPITAEDLTCHICKKVYKNPNSLRDHIKRHISDRKRNFTCDRCGKTFYNKGTLSSHIMAHDEIRPHVCRICNKSFIFPNMLRRHVEMHSGVKPFSCEQCGRCFRLQYQLNNHKIIHTDSMPFSCQYCNKAFRFKQILKNHERQHTGAKPYSCQHCGMEFSNWSNYNKHTKRRHNIDTSKKKITPEGVFPINPETGQIMQVDIQGVEEWKSRIMVPAKRGKKKVIKEESDI